MSDIKNIRFGVCNVCLKPICQCPKPKAPHALTREQVETTISRFLSWHDCEAECDHDLKQVLLTDAALRQALAQQAQEVERLKKELASQEVQMNAVRYRAEQAEQQLAAMTAERDAARAIVAKVNNAVIGSDGYFTEPSCIEAIGALKVQCNQLQATLAERERDIDKLKADLNEMWVDDKGTVWTKPTAWAYAMVCKARDKHAQDAARLRMLIFRLLNDLPTKRDWLDPDLEKALKGA